MGYLIGLIMTMIGMMIVLKLVFAEMDGKRAAKQLNIRYFLQFTQNFTYGRTNHIFYSINYFYI